MGILLRWLGAFALLAVTFNPTDWNYVRWAMSHTGSDLPLVVFAGLLLAAAYIVYLHATLSAIGASGMLFIAALFVAAVWVLMDWGLLDLNNTDLAVWLAILALSLVLGVGLSWARIRLWLSGQQTLDEPRE